MISTLQWIPKGVLKAKPEAYMPEEELMEKDVFDNESEEEYENQGDFMDAMMEEQLVELDEADMDVIDEEMDMDDIIKQTDHILCVGKVGEVSTLEYQIFDTVERSLYIHRDLMLPSVPLSSEFVHPYVVIGTFEPEIELWNSNYYDKLTPDAVLSGHKDAILDLKVNSNAKNVLLSASADSTIKLWDITKQKKVDTFKHHGDKVQTIHWNTEEPTIFASGGFDGSVFVGDTRAKNNFLNLSIGGEIERVRWGFNSNEVFISTNSGDVMSYDIRNQSRLYTIGLTNSCTFTKSISNLLVISSPQEHNSIISVWRINEKPERLFMKSVDGNVLDIVACPEDPQLIAIAGNTSQVWDLSSIKKLRKCCPEIDALEKKNGEFFSPYDFDEQYSSDNE